MKPLPSARWEFPDARTLPTGIDYAGSGLDWDEATVLHAYAHGYFPMPRDLESDEIDWWSPESRAVFDPSALRISRSLRRSLRRFRVTVNGAFDAVVGACADPQRDSGWIDSHVRGTYGRLHQQGWAHSVEVWHEDELVGGLYGVELGGLFAGESMFHTFRDASKVALVSLAALMRDAGGPRRIDCQWMTPHLRSLGAVEISREQYLAELPMFLANAEAIGVPPTH